MLERRQGEQPLAEDYLVTSNAIMQIPPLIMHLNDIVQSYLCS